MVDEALGRIRLSPDGARLLWPRSGGAFLCVRAGSFLSTPSSANFARETPAQSVGVFDGPAEIHRYRFGAAPNRDHRALVSLDQERWRWVWQRDRDRPSVQRAAGSHNL